MKPSCDCCRLTTGREEGCEDFKEGSDSAHQEKV